MELTAYARSVILGTSLVAKLSPPPSGLTDETPGPGERFMAPGRPANLQIAPNVQARVPPPVGMRDPVQRVRILHALANHELQATELFAWAIVLFPDAPSAFRRGLLKILVDEQRHCRLYMERIEALGAQFGDFPVSAHFWNKAPAITTPLQFVCTMGLTFENANLDFCIEHIEAARAAGDEASARVLEQVHEDEIAHVAFAWHWFDRWRPTTQDAWAAFDDNVALPDAGGRARGRTFDVDSRVSAGLDAAFIERLRDTPPTRPGGGRR